MIILFHLKLYKLYSTGAMNLLKMICIPEIFFSSLTSLLSKMFFVHMKMSYYLLNRQEILQKAEDRHHNCGGKERAAENYIDNKDVLNESANNKYRNLSEEEKK